MSVPLAFIKRDFSQEVSYRMSFIMQLGGIIFSVAIFYFMSRLFGTSVAPQLQDYGGDYFSFVLIGDGFAPTWSSIQQSSSCNTIFARMGLATPP